MVIGHWSLVVIDSYTVSAIINNLPYTTKKLLPPRKV